MFTTLDNGCIIADSIYIGDGIAPSSATLTLRLQQWQSVMYDKTPWIIDYPGEYELSWYIIWAWVDKQWKMQYVIRHGQKKIALIQSAEWLEHDMITSMTIWYITNQSLQDAIEMRELEWEVVLLPM